MISFFTGIWSKVAAGFAVLSGLFFLFIRYQSNKIGNLKDENETLKANKEAQKKQDTFKQEIQNKEAVKLQEALIANAKKSKLDKLNDN